MKLIAWEPILQNALKLIKSALVRTLAFIRKHLKLLAITAAIIIALGVTALVLYNRPPVLVLTDVPFIELYGKERLRRQRAAASLALFRRVKPVITADGASPDIQVAAISGAAKNPYCVLFPAYLAAAAERYHLEFPETPAAVLAGYGALSGLPQPDGVLCVYRTDLETDLYRAGLLAGLLGLEKSLPDTQRTCFLWQDRYIQAPEREAFSSGLRESDPDGIARFANSASDLLGPEAISCVVLTRSGAEYLDKNPKTPLILFTWLDPLMLPAQAVAAFDDSAWALAVPAARMAASSQAEGKIPSKPLVFSGKTADNGIDQILKQLAKKKP